MVCLQRCSFGVCYLPIGGFYFFGFHEVIFLNVSLFFCLLHFSVWLACCWVRAEFYGGARLGFRTCRLGLPTLFGVHRSRFQSSIDAGGVKLRAMARSLVCVIVDEGICS